MAQQPPRFCSECGTPLQAGQRFCTNCGATMNVDASSPTAAATPATVLAGDSPAGPAELPAGGSNTPAAPTQFSSMPTEPDVEQPSVAPPPPMMGSGPQGPGFTGLTPPPPPPTSGTYNPYAASAPGGTQTYAQNVSSPGYSPSSPGSPGLAPISPGATYTPVPAYAQKPRRGHGCLITSIILLVVLAAGIAGFVFLNRARSGTAQNPGTTPTSGSAANTPVTSNGSTPTAVVSISQPLNLKITYAGVNITIVSAQIARSFPDDTFLGGAGGMLRINLQENNSTTSSPGYIESASMLLVLPDGTTVQQVNQKQGISPDGGVNRPNWLDFPLSSQVSISQLTLRIGTSTENQMSVPLRPGANLTKYQDRTSSPNLQFQYAGVNWTLKTATLSYSYGGKQATLGNLYVVLNLSAVNQTSNAFINGPSSYMRLQANGNSAEPENTTTLPISIAANATASGVVAFLMPQEATSFTLVMLAQPNVSPPINQVTQSFQIQ